jgi:hypothetical protein
VRTPVAGATAERAVGARRVDGTRVVVRDGRRWRQTVAAADAAVQRAHGVAGLVAVAPVTPARVVAGAAGRKCGTGARGLVVVVCRGRRIAVRPPAEVVLIISSSSIRVDTIAFAAAFFARDRRGRDRAQHQQKEANERIHIGVYCL